MMKGRGKKRCPSVCQYGSACVRFWWLLWWDAEVTEEHEWRRFKLSASLFSLPSANVSCLVFLSRLFPSRLCDEMPVLNTHADRNREECGWVMCDELCQGLAEKKPQEHHCFYFSLIKGAAALLLWERILRLSFTWWDGGFVPQLTGWWLDWWASEAPVLHVYLPGEHTGCDCYMFRKNILDI